jgi:hypothetical protein
MGTPLSWDKKSPQDFSRRLSVVFGYGRLFVVKDALATETIVLTCIADHFAVDNRGRPVEDGLDRLCHGYLQGPRNTSQRTAMFLA